MCELYALSSATPTVPRDDLAVLQGHAKNPFGNLQGWGICWESETGPVLHKAPEPASNAGGYPAIALIAPESKQWIVHLRAASSGGVSLENTQPYLFELDGGEAVFAHNGELKEIGKHPEFLAHQDEHQGNADSECAQIILKYRLRRAIGIEARWEIFRAFAAEMRGFGPANFIVRIGADIFAHADRRKPVGTDELKTPGLTLLDTKGQVRVSSEPLGPDDVELARGEMVWLRDGAVKERRM